MGGLVIEVDDPRRDDVRRLLAQHRSFAGGVMPPDGVHVLDPDEDVTLFSVRVDGELLGIGALTRRSPRGEASDARCSTLVVVVENGGAWTRTRSGFSSPIIWPVSMPRPARPWSAGLAGSPS